MSRAFCGRWRVAALVGLALWIVATTADARPWTINGKRYNTGLFVRMYEGQAIVKIGNRVMKVPFYDLAQEDQDFVRQQLQAKGQEDLIPPKPTVVAAEKPGDSGSTGNFSDSPIPRSSFAGGSSPSQYSPPTRIPSPPSYTPPSPSPSSPPTPSYTPSPPPPPPVSSPSSSPSHSPPSTPQIPEPPRIPEPRIPDNSPPGLPGGNDEVMLLQCNKCKAVVRPNPQNRCSNCGITWDFTQRSDGKYVDRQGNVTTTPGLRFGMYGIGGTFGIAVFVGLLYRLIAAFKN